MCDTVEEESAVEANPKLLEWINHYCDTDSDAKCTDSRNHILIEVVKGGDKAFVQIVSDHYEKEEDLVRKKNICRLVFEVLSRTENLFSAEDLVPLLHKSLTVTICTQFAIVALKALLQRHVRLEGTSMHLLTVLQPVYDLLLSQGIASMAQQPRIDFLWLTHFFLDAYRRHGVRSIKDLIPRFCAAVAGEKDPRNLLMIFDLVAKFCADDLSDDDVEALAKVYTSYYPIQFSPPKNDRIGIKPSELKERLLKAFKACTRFGAHSMEVMIDCLYSGYGTTEEHTVVLGDTLWFVEECAPVYGVECYTDHLDSFVDVILSEFFMAADHRENDDARSSASNLMAVSVDSDNDELDYDTFSVTQANAIGDLYYEDWRFVSKQLRLFGDILRVFMNSIDVDKKRDVIVKFLGVLREQFTADNSKNVEANGHAGYFLDIFCGIERYHELVLECVMVPLCNDVVVKYTDFKRGSISEMELCTQLTLTLPVLTSTLFAKLVSRCKQPIPTKFAKHIVVCALCCIQLSDNKMFVRGLKLLTLAVVSSKCRLLEQVLTHCLKESRLFTRSPAGRDGKDISHYADALLAVLKCHYPYCTPVLKLIEQMMDDLMENENIEESVSAYVKPDRGLSHEVAEIIATTIDKSTDAALLKKIVAVCCRCFVYVCEHPDSKILYAVYLFSLAVAANRSKLSTLVKGELSFSQILGYYKVFWQRGKHEELPHVLMKFATHILPQHMAMTSDEPIADVAKQLCQEGLAFLLPSILTDMNQEVVDVIMEYSKRDEITVFELEAMASLLERWIAGSSSVKERTETDALATSVEDATVFDEKRNASAHETSLARFRSVSSARLPPLIFSYLLASIDFETLESFDLKKHLESVPPNVMSSLVSRMFTFQGGKLASTLEHLGFNTRGFTNSRMSYMDLFFVDGTALDTVPPMVRMQYKFMTDHRHGSPRPDVRVTKHFLQTLSEMKDSLPVVVAIGTIAMWLDDSELVNDYANVAHLIVRHYVKQWPNLDAVKSTNASMQQKSDVKQDIKCSYLSSYEMWLQDEFLFLSQSLLLRIMCQMERPCVPMVAKRRDFDYCDAETPIQRIEQAKWPVFSLEGWQWEQLADVAASVAIGSSLPACRILGMLIVHCVVKAAPNTLSMASCRSVMKHDDGFVDMRTEQPTDRQPYVTYLKRWNEYMGISRDVVEQSARRLNPVELQLQAVSDLLHRQKLRCNDRATFGRVSPMRAPFVNSLGVELATDMEALVDRFEASRDETKTWVDSFASLWRSSAQKCNDVGKLERDAFRVLAEHWKKRGYLAPPGERVECCDTVTIRDMSKDIGSEAVPYLFCQEPKENSIWDWLMPKTPECSDGLSNLKPNRVLSLAVLDRIDANLRQYGIAVVRNVFEKEDIKIIRRALHLDSSMAREGAYKIMSEDPNVTVVKHTRGRIQCVMRGTSFERKLATLQRFWMPIIYYSLGRNLYISNVNLVSSDAMSYVEPWHRNNRNFGLTVLLALDDINEKTGRIQFLPGTHNGGTWVSPYKTGKVAVDLKMGDVLIFDSRLLHRHTTYARLLSCVFRSNTSTAENIAKKDTSLPKSTQHSEPVDPHKLTRDVQRKSTGRTPVNLISLGAGRRTQSIGYTLESFPNPLTSPGSCVHSASGARSLLCDPDGILSDHQQVELNELLCKERKYRIFVALAHSLLMPENQKDTQENFAKQLLSEWGGKDAECLLMVYVEDLGELKLAANVKGVFTQVPNRAVSTKVSQANVRAIEETFLKRQLPVFDALKQAITSVEVHLAGGKQSYFTTILIVGVLSLVVWAFLSRNQIKVY
ncbi:small nuclear ribonucleoprotein Sm D1, putative [Babesia caballi]|uniref:MMS19 nucleotide excision repair protein n=1 Tax=Babesia caballi TaxID=5871 RepID=A0AAV4LTN8_BABCB|nr:small nuclear ribonucleoprotein Sm D1, putative [Babesia caballi]